jgi:hypothetical protein
VAVVRAQEELRGRIRRGDDGWRTACDEEARRAELTPGADHPGERTMASKKAVFGMLNSRQHAENVVLQLQGAGFLTDDISVLFPDQGGTRDFAFEKHTKAPEGASIGGAAGGAIGGTLGLLAGIGALAIPGIGPFIAAGPIMAALSGAAAGAAVGGLTGALVGMGIPEIEAKQYETKIRSGGILISVHVDDATERKRAKDILLRNGAQHVSAIGEEHVSHKDQQPHSRP